MNLHPLIESRLQKKLGASGSMTVGDVWDVFCSEYKVVKRNKPQTMFELGVLAELFLKDDESKNCFSFAFYYRVKVRVDGELYCFYELVYCEFDLTEVRLESAFKNDSIEVWESLNPFSDATKKIEKWHIFKELKHLKLNYKVFGDEV